MKSMPQDIRKPYAKPGMVSRQIELGVFGDYRDPRFVDSGTKKPHIVPLVRDLDLRME